MPALTCRLVEFPSTSYDRRGRGVYTLVYRIRMDASEGNVPDPDEVINSALAGSLPVRGDDGIANDPIPPRNAIYDLRNINGTWITRPYRQAGCQTFRSVNPCTFADNYDLVPDTGDQQYTYLLRVMFTPLREGEPPQYRLQTNPFRRPAIFHWESETYTERLTQDWFGNGIKNPCGRAFDLEQNLQRTRGVLIARFNVENLDVAAFMDRTLSESVNATPWRYLNPTREWQEGGEFLQDDPSRDVPVRVALCRYVRSGPIQYEPVQNTLGCTIPYIPVEVAFAFANPGDRWDHKYRNEGYGYFLENEALGAGYATVGGPAGTVYPEGTTLVPISSTITVTREGDTAAPSNNTSGTFNNLLGYPVRSGDTIPFHQQSIGSPWILGDPDLATDSEGEPIYIDTLAPQTRPGETEESAAVSISEPVMLRHSGGLLPDEMTPTYTYVRARAEVDFDTIEFGAGRTLNNYLNPLGPYSPSNPS